MLTAFVVDGLVLNLAPLVTGLHGAEHTASVGQSFELLQNGFFHQAGEFIDDERPLVRVFVLRQPPLLINDELHRQCPAHGFLRRRRYGLVIGIGVQAVAIVIGGDQCLQGRANIVEIHFLGVQGTPGCLSVIFELLATLVRSVLESHGRRPNAPRHPAHDRVLRFHADGKEERQIRRETVDVHSPRKISLHIGEAIGQGQSQLRQGVGAGLGDVITGNRYRVEIPNAIVDEVLGDVAHDLEAEFRGEDTGVLPLILFEDIGLHGTAHVFQHPGLLRRCFILVRLTSEFLAQGIELLIEGGIEEHGQHGGRGPVDGHGHGGFRIAQIEAVVEHFHIVEGSDGNAGIADFSVNVRPTVGIEAVQSDGIESGGQTLGFGVLGKVLEPLIGAECVTLAGKHTRWIFAFAPEWKHAGGEGKSTGQILL